MANHTTLASLFSDIATAIRGKTGSTATIVADNFPDAISAISTKEDLAAELATQDSLIAQIAAVLEEKKPVPKIVFNVGMETYSAESGMTWGEWVASPYNTGGFVLEGQDIRSPSYEYVLNAYASDVISANVSYGLGQ